MFGNWGIGNTIQALSEVLEFSEEINEFLAWSQQTISTIAETEKNIQAF